MFNGGQKITNAAVGVSQVELNNAIAAGVRQSQLNNIENQARNNRLEEELRKTKQALSDAEYDDWLLHQPIEVIAQKHGVFRQHLDQFLKQREHYRQYYEDLLCKPMQEIAKENGKFKETYEEQMTLMADWMVSQKAFKELAIEFGWEKGLELAKVIEMGQDKKIDVLENKHNPSHITNASDAHEIMPRKELLTEQYKQRMVERKAK